MHCSSKINSRLFQPNAEEQRMLIIKNMSKRMINAMIKKETKKVRERIKVRTIRMSQRADALEQYSKMYAVPSSMRSNLDLPRMFVSPRSTRPTSCGVTINGVVKRSEFADVLKSHLTTEEFDAQLKRQFTHLVSDPKVVFDAISTSFKHGISFTFHPKNQYEEIDCSPFFETVSALAAIQSLEDLHKNIKKREGIAIILDPTLNTGGQKVSLRVTYVRKNDEADEETSKEHVIYSDGNYFGLEMTAEVDTNTNDSGRHCSLPGWQGRLPIMVPSSKCVIRIMTEKATTATLSSTQPERRIFCFRAFAVPCSSTKNALKKLTTFCEEHFTASTANLVVPGKITALNVASLHGNMEVANCNIYMYTYCYFCNTCFINSFRCICKAFDLTRFC